MQKRKLRRLDFQVRADDVHIVEVEYQYEDPIEGLSQRTIFRSIKTIEPMNKFASRTSKELTAGFAKTKQTTMDSKQRKKRKEDTIRYTGK